MRNVRVFLPAEKLPNTICTHFPGKTKILEYVNFAKNTFLKYILIILNYAVKCFFFIHVTQHAWFSFWVYNVFEILFNFQKQHNNRTKTSLLKKCPALICLHTLTHGGFRSLNPPSFSSPFSLRSADLTAVALYFNLTIFFFSTVSQRLLSLSKWERAATEQHLFSNINILMLHTQLWLQQILFVHWLLKQHMRGSVECCSVVQQQTKSCTDILIEWLLRYITWPWIKQHTTWSRSIFPLSCGATV